MKHLGDLIVNVALAAFWVAFFVIIGNEIYDKFS
jgi:hypothetical protein